MIRKCLGTVAAATILISTPAMANEKQINCIAQAIYFEARGEDKQGQVAVGNVVMNRVKDARYPSTPCKVVYQKSQFSWTAHNPKISKNPIFDHCWNLARKIYNGEVRDVTNGAQHFHARTIRPYWASKYKLTIKIGGHLFYRG